MWKTTGIFMLIGIIAFADRRVNASCPLEMNPPSVVARYGDTVSVNCSTPSTDHQGMGWESKLGGTDMEENVKLITWTVETLKPENWEIEPQCYINLPDQQCSKDLPVTLYTFPDSITISSIADSAGPMYEGEQYTITCGIRHIAPVQNLTVTWYKDDTILDTNFLHDPSKKKKPQNVLANFTFTASRVYDGARFRCEVFLNLGPEGPQHSNFSEEYPIKVHYGPDIACSHNITISEGQNLEHQCSVTGNPSPTIAWFKDGHRIDQAVALSRHNAGLYTIEAKGRINTNRTLHVLVMYPPTFFSSQTETLDLAMDPADKITLNCTATGNPTPTYRWQCTNTKQEKMGDQSVITTTLFPGLCNCTVSNDVGTKTKQFIINEPEVNRSRTTFWAMVGPPVAIALLALIGYVVYKTIEGNNSGNRQRQQVI